MTELLEQVRRLVDEARQAGDPPPGRPTLVRQLAAQAQANGQPTPTDHQVRQALAAVTANGSPAAASASSPAVTSDPASMSTAGANGSPAVDSPAATSPSPARRQRAASRQPTSRRRQPTSTRHQRVASAPATSPPALPQPTTSGPPAASPPATHQPAARITGGRIVAWTAFLFGSITSVAANVIAAKIPPPDTSPDWHPSLAAEIGAAVWPLALLLSVEVVSRVRWPAGFLWALARYGGAGTVAAGSAVISYAHIRTVITAWGYPTLAGLVGPLVIDGLMVVSGFAMLVKPTAGGRQ